MYQENVMRKNAGITVGELKRWLAAFGDDCELYMGGLTFYRLKQRGDKLVQFEFNEQVCPNESGTVIVEQLH